jgi:hypothetical protein
MAGLGFRAAEPVQPLDDPSSFYGDLVGVGEERQKRSVADETGESEEEEAAGSKGREAAGFFCDVCEERVKETSEAEHVRSSVHLLSQQHQVVHRPFVLDESNVGYRMMMAQGWKEGGLGIHEHGRLQPIKTIVKKSRAGVGGGREVARITHELPAQKKKQALERALTKYSSVVVSAEQVELFSSLACLDRAQQRDRALANAGLENDRSKRARSRLKERAALKDEILRDEFFS